MPLLARAPWRRPSLPIGFRCLIQPPSSNVMDEDADDADAVADDTMNNAGSSNADAVYLSNGTLGSSLVSFDIWT